MMFNRRKREIELLKSELDYLIKDYGIYRKEAISMVSELELELVELKEENQTLINGTDNLLEQIIELKSELKTHKINNFPEYPCEVEIQFHIGAKKQVFFDGKNFLKANGATYRLASIKSWSEFA